MVNADGLVAIGIGRTWTAMANVVQTQSMLASYGGFACRLGAHFIESFWRKELILTIAAAIR